VGNALEVREALAVLGGGGPPDTVELTCELGAEMLVLGGATDDLEDGRKMLRAALADGSARDRFAALIEAQGGDPEVCRDPSRLPTAAHRAPVLAPRAGYVAAIAPREVAQSALEVGAGRRTKEDAIDPATGVELAVVPGDPVDAGEPLAHLHHNGANAGTARELLAGAFDIADEPPPPAPLIIERI